MAERYLEVYRRGSVELEAFPPDGSTIAEAVSLPQAASRL